MINFNRLLFQVFIVSLLLLSHPVTGKEINGFELDDALIPSSQIFSGGPAKDGIPAINNPKFVNASDVKFLQNNDRILGININGESRAYPISILNWHEIVNDVIGDTYFAVTYCPLCGTGVAFNSTVDGRVLHFGASGLLYNSDVLLYDRETESLWSQLLTKAVTGQYRGTELTMLPVQHTTWRDWKRLHPSSLVLSNNTGYKRDYGRDPYSGYEQSRKLYFPVNNTAPKRYHPKEIVLGVEIDGVYKAYPFIELNKNNKEKFTDTVNDKLLFIHWTSHENSAYIIDDKGDSIPVIQAYWFAWYAFHPQTVIFSAE